MDRCRKTTLQLPVYVTIDNAVPIYAVNYNLVKLPLIPLEDHFFFGDQANTFTGAIPRPWPSLY